MKNQEGVEPPQTGKPRPPVLRALGKADPPATLQIRGEVFHRQKIYKHDSWAASALYAGEQRKLVCKFNRVQPFGFVPTKWLGRWLASRESYFLRRLENVKSVPEWCGPVRVNGREMKNASAHWYVEGEPLRDHDRVNDLFFPQMIDVLAEVHASGIAYIDLHKKENIILGADGSPHLIDFQICQRLPSIWPFSWIRAVLFRCDRYHLAKHIRFMRPDQCDARVQKMLRRPWWIRAHRTVAVPFRELRRRFLVGAGIRRGTGKISSEHFVEDGLRSSGFERRGADA